MPVSPVSPEWAAFLSGHWTRERPTRPGTYPVCALGVPPGAQTMVFFIDPSTGKIASPNDLAGSGWRGWFWSEPMPRLPAPPDCPPGGDEP